MEFDLVAFTSGVRNGGKDAPDMRIRVVKRLRGNFSSHRKYKFFWGQGIFGNIVGIFAGASVIIGMG